MDWVLPICAVVNMATLTIILWKLPSIVSHAYRQGKMDTWAFLHANLPVLIEQEVRAHMSPPRQQVRNQGYVFGRDSN